MSGKLDVRNKQEFMDNVSKFSRTENEVAQEICDAITNIMGYTDGMPISLVRCSNIDDYDPDYCDKGDFFLSLRNAKGESVISAKPVELKPVYFQTKSGYLRPDPWHYRLKQKQTYIEIERDIPAIVCTRWGSGNEKIGVFSIADLINVVNSITPQKDHAYPGKFMYPMDDFDTAIVQFHDWNSIRTDKAACKKFLDELARKCK